MIRHPIKLCIIIFYLNITLDYYGQINCGKKVAIKSAPAKKAAPNR